METARKKRIFIGSSSETKELSKKIKDSLVENCDCIAWYDDFFELGNYVFNDLIQKAISFDYAILIGGADDKVIRLSTHKRKLSPRDNVYLEYGMFSGILSTNRILFLVHEKCTVASDLAGMTLMQYKNEKDALDKTQKWLTDMFEGKRTRVFSALDVELLPTVGIAVGYYHNFVVPLIESLQNITTFSYEGKDYPIENKKLIINIPSYIDNISQYERALVEHEKLVKTELNRYRILINPQELERGNLFVYDLPTTLRAVFETIAYIFDLNAGETEDSKYAKYRALDNFFDTIPRLMDGQTSLLRLVEVRRFNPFELGLGA